MKLTIEFSDVTPEQLDQILSILTEDRMDGEAIPDRETIEKSLDTVGSGIDLSEFPPELIDSLEARADPSGPTIVPFYLVEKRYPKDALVQQAKGNELMERAVSIVYSEVNPDDYDIQQLVNLVEATVKMLKKA